VHPLRITLIVVLTGVFIFSVTSGSFLVVNDLRPADVIVVLAGETDSRPARALQLLSENFAPKVLLDVSAKEIVFNQKLIQIAQSYVDTLPEHSAISICPILGLSTKAESYDVRRCLEHSNVHSILLVTSDYHTRRAHSIFKRELPEYRVFVAPAEDSLQFGASWWQHRQWAKMNYDEWTRLAWWEAVDRWR
jgi:DUF218 domain